MLMLHTGNAVEFARADLPTDVVRPKDAGSRWRGVPHRDLAEGVCTELARRDCELVTDRWATMRKGQALIGVVELRLPDIEEIPGQGYAVGISHANDMSQPMRIVVGSRVFVCDNGAFTGEYVLRRKHTSGLNLGWEIRNSIERALTQFNETRNVIDGMKTRRMDAGEIDHAWVEMGRRDILPWSAIGKAVALYDEPPHDEFKEFDGRAWGVYQAANEVIKQRSPLDQMDGLKRLTELLKKAA